MSSVAIRYVVLSDKLISAQSSMHLKRIPSQFMTDWHGHRLHPWKTHHMQRSTLKLFGVQALRIRLNVAVWPQNMHQRRSFVSQPQIAVESIGSQLVSSSNIPGSALEYVSSGTWCNPVNVVATLLESIHSYCGLSWPVSIVIFTAGLRAALLPFNISQMRNAARTKELKPTIDKYNAQIKELRREGKSSESMEKLLELRSLMRKNKVGVLRSFGLTLLPIPFFVSSFFALRNMAAQPIPSFLCDGAMWFTDLSARDPFFILPVLSTAALIASFEVSL